MEKIEGFKDEFRFLSNFYFSTINWRGKRWLTSEHAYQAAKTSVEQEQEEIRLARNPAQAKRLGKAVTMREDWNEIRVDVMREIVREKFSQNEQLKRMLLATEDLYIEETNYWGDTFWGVCKGKGENNLGKILMEIRQEFREEALNELTKIAQENGMGY